MDDAQLLAAGQGLGALAPPPLTLTIPFAAVTVTDSWGGVMKVEIEYCVV